MKSIKQDNRPILKAILFVALFCTQTIANASLLGSFTTKVSGNISGTENSFTPLIHLNNSAILFEDLTIKRQDIGKEFSISSNSDDEDFTTFINKLTNNVDDVLTVGHQIGFIRGNHGNLESNWFKKNLNGKKITRISLRYDLVQFKVTHGAKTWTTFNYQLTLSIYDEAMTPDMALVDKDLNRSEIINSHQSNKDGQLKPIAYYDDDMDDFTTQSELQSKGISIITTQSKTIPTEDDNYEDIAANNYQNLIMKYIIDQISSYFE